MIAVSIQAAILLQLAAKRNAVIFIIVTVPTVKTSDYSFMRMLDINENDNLVSGNVLQLPFLQYIFI